MNARGVIESALRKIRVARAGFDPAAEDVNDAFELLNAMVSSWAGESLLIPYRHREAFTLTAALNPHSIGPGGAIDTVQPMKIEALVLNDGAADYDVDVLFTAQEYQKIRVKGLTARPERVWFERGLTTGSLYFDFVPDAAYTGSMLSLKPITRFASLSTDLPVPEQYELALTFNLAVLLAPEYGKEAPGTVQRFAESSLRIIKDQVVRSRVPIAEVDPSLLRSRRFDINVIE